MHWQDMLNQRASCPLLVAPAPTNAQLTVLLEAALSAPDHGRLRPWRFLVLTGTQRQRLGDIFVNAAKADDPTIDAAAAERLKAKPLRAPMIITVVAEVTENHRVPVKEQVMSTACAAEHIMLAAHAQGLGAMWRTGGMASHALVKKALGFAPKDEIVGFLYVGTPDPAYLARLAKADNTAPKRLADFLREMR